MAESATDIKAISKRNEGFPEWLDFDRMRKEGIEYIAKLSGKIWTDHNISDPGITILETLCYALLDLGYRTSLPPKDLFAKDPDDPSRENNFFTPSQILSCNPLTITDYRRLLVDIPGVKNAWLTTAEDITIDRICNPGRDTRTGHNFNPDECSGFLNGLYHVYLDLEAESNDEQKKKILEDVKKALMSHRNLCEDFYDITILCKQKIGVCADIELDPTADPDKVFLQLVETLRDFFSPSPKFYRLNQLVEEKGRSIEQVFAGRPFNLTRSHGFVDIEEFEKIEMRKEIHHSDIFNIVFNIPGIRSIRSLFLQNCDGTVCSDHNNEWIFNIYENHVPDFSLDCSGFQFTRNGGSIIIDMKKFGEYLKLNFTNSGKTLSYPPSPNLDYVLEQGNFRKDLDAYYPIENEFPKIYGVASGSLPDDVSPLRKSQALQLRSFLLFFDHFLSGYLSQLRNIRSLFSFTSVKESNSYFINKISGADWPDLQQLVAYKVGENEQAKVIAMPVQKQDLDALILNGRIDVCGMESTLPAYLFSSKSETQSAVYQLIEDLTFGAYTGYVIENTNDCWFYYICGSSDNIAIIGKESYKTKADAEKALDTLRYSCTDIKSYRSYSTGNDSRFSFDIASSVAGYWKFLQDIMEDEKHYLLRRNGFLDHLLSRFAESFTDYALLSYPFKSDSELQKNNIAKKERFLTNYPELSSERGKAYDYHLNGWNNLNDSGLEKRFSALTGIGNDGFLPGSRQNLCHFEVLELPEQTMVNILWKDQLIFKSEKSFESREDGRLALSSLLTALTGRENYKTDFGQIEGKYTVTVKANEVNFIYPHKFETEEEARAVIPQLQRIFSPAALNEDIIPSKFKHTLFLRRKSDDNRWVRKEPVFTREAILTVSPELLLDFKDTGSWLADKDDIDREAVSFQSNPDQPLELINTNAFEPYINRVDVKKQSTLYKYAVNDPQKNFFFISNEVYTSENEAKAQMLRMLFLLTDSSNVYAGNSNSGETLIYVKGKEGPVATNTIEYTNREEAELFIPRIVDYMVQHVFNLDVESEPVNWRYLLRLGMPGKKIYKFTSKAEYKSFEEASQRADMVTAGPANFEVYKGKNDSLELKAVKEKKHPGNTEAVHALQQGESLESAMNEAKELLSFRKTMNHVLRNPNDPEAEKMIVADWISRQGNFAYRLVKKDGFHAVYDTGDDFSSLQSREKIIKHVYSVYQNNHEYLQICYGGEQIIHERISGNGIPWYHFLIKTIGEGHEMTLFESVNGYTSVQEAEKAFEEAYVQILTAASDASNYGNLVSFDEIFLHDKDNCSGVKAKVFVPKKTMEQFGYNLDQARQALSGIASTYPIRSIKNTDQLFIDYFHCGNKNEIYDPCREDCAKKEKYYYYFLFKTRGDKTGGWRSYRYFETAKEALSAFRFFLVLLRYKGNYHIHHGDCDCRQFLYLREILAISKRRFPAPDDAWGKQGVMKFICSSQSKDAFPSYLKNDGCCYSFHVACGNLGLIHPCNYDSPHQRDQALRKLFEASRKFSEDMDKWDWNNIAEEIIGRKPGKGAVCEEAIRTIELFLENNNNTGTRIHDTDERARWFAHYYPVLRKSHGDTEDIHYYVRINLPDFCTEDLKEQGPCGCNEKDSDLHCCCTAWESECCFETCEEAFRYYYRAVRCLANIDNYYSVFNCECGSYGIRFHCDCVPAEAHDGKEEHHQCCNEILAVNPQCYPTPGMACDAVERAKKLINCEGIHLVEHILLRPHCTNGDCDCLIPRCDDIPLCDDFEWILPDDDPCEKDKKYSFVPGRDPYSFIATAVLPAWPERYRNAENRQLLEQLLHREVPAHIMLRIIWLSPKDFCHFESTYHNWTKWLAHKEICEEYSPHCHLIELLFRDQLECFDCDECLPCTAVSTVPDHCNFRENTPRDPFGYLNAINDLYCWTPFCPDNTDRKISPGRTPDINYIKQPEPQSKDTEEAERIIDRRFYRYREEVRRIADSTDNVYAGRALAFLSEPSPQFSVYREVIDAIISNKKTKKNIKILSAEEKSKLIRSVTGYYLDRMILEDRLVSQKNDLSKIFRNLENRQLLPSFREWKASELAGLLQDTSEVKKLLKKRS